MELDAKEEDKHIWCNNYVYVDLPKRNRGEREKKYTNNMDAELVIIIFVDEEYIKKWFWGDDEWYTNLKKRDMEKY